jgi:hypothetical protein
MFTGFKRKVSFFLSEVDFEKLFKVMGFSNVFENGEKCNVLLMYMLFFVFCMFGEV